jgi:RNA polymerase sigma-70 factor (ECF subfamily)
MQDQSDEDLRARVAQGEQSAFRLLAARHAAPAVGLARRLSGSHADAEEIVQEALLRVWIHAPRWRPLASFRTWFYRVVLNLCLNRRRRAPGLPLEAAGDPADPEVGADTRMEQDEANRTIAAAIAALPERQRAAIVLTYYQGLSNAETAQALDASVSAVETLLVRGKRSLRERLGPLIERD